MRQPQKPNLLITPSDVEPFDRGNGVATIPYVGKWNCQDNKITTGQTSFQPGTGLPLHSHNCEESVLILEGEAVAQINDDTFDLEVGQATWVPAGVPHRFSNRGDGADAHLLGLRRPRRHPHHHRYRRDLRAPLRERQGWPQHQLIPPLITARTPRAGAISHDQHHHHHQPGDRRQTRPATPPGPPSSSSRPSPRAPRPPPLGGVNHWRPGWRPCGGSPVSCAVSRTPSQL